MNDDAGAPGLSIVQILLGQPRDEWSPIWIGGYATFEDGFGFLVTSEIFECGSKVQIGGGIFRSELQGAREIVGGFGIILLSESATAPRQVRTTGSLGADLASSYNFCSAYGASAGSLRATVQ